MKEVKSALLAQTDYVEALKFLMSQFKGGSKGLQSKIADFVGVRQAYLSRVFSRQADLNQEQILAVAVFFALDAHERDFLLNLLNLNRAGTEDLRRYYKEKLMQIRARHHNMGGRIEKTQELSDDEKAAYYSDWTYAAIHTLTAIPSYQTPHSIAVFLNLDTEKVLHVLTFLTRVGLVLKKENDYQHSLAPIHLDSNSIHIGHHHTNWRLKAVDDIGRNGNKNMHYTSVISCSEKDFIEIQEMLVGTIKKAREKIKISKNEKIYCYAIDAFSIS